MLAFRKAKIRSHRKALLEAQRGDDSDGDLSYHVYRLSGGEHRHLGMAFTEVPLKMHVTRGVIARLEPFHLPLLLFYTFCLLLLTEHNNIPSSARHIGNAGSALVNALSMVSGLLLSYESSSALGRWEQGRKVWVDLRGEIRSATRMISLIHPVDSPLSPSWTEVSESPRPDFVRSRQLEAKDKERVVQQRAEELSALVVIFAFALRYHLNKTRAPLTQPPFSDLLPPSYLSTLKRTDSSVRFADKHMEGVNSNTIKPTVKTRAPSPTTSDHRPGSPSARGRMINLQAKRGRKRSTSGRPVKSAAGAGGVFEMDRLSTTTEEDETGSSAVDMMEDSDLSPMGGDDLEPDLSIPSLADKQIQQLNVPRKEQDHELEPILSGTSTSSSKPSSESVSTDPVLLPRTLPISLQPSPSISVTPSDSHNRMSEKLASRHHPRLKTKGVLANKYPHNLPLAILRMMEGYVNGLVQAGEEADASEKIGWTASQGEKGYSVVRKLGDLLGEAEMLADSAPPLAHSLHLTHILFIVLMAIPAQLLPQLGRWTIPIALISGWALLGMQALSKEVGGVFGFGENHLPTHRYCADILSESLDMSEILKQGYTRRVEARCGSSGSVKADGALRLLKQRRVEDWLPSFEV